MADKSASVLQSSTETKIISVWKLYFADLRFTFYNKNSLVLVYVLVGISHLPERCPADESPAAGQNIVELDEVFPQSDRGELNTEVLCELLQVDGGAVLGRDETEQRVGAGQTEDVGPEDWLGLVAQGLVVIDNVKLRVEERVRHRG